MASIFEYRKPASIQSQRDKLRKLRETLEQLESEGEQTPQIAQLKGILTARIQELESKTA